MKWVQHHPERQLEMFDHVKCDVPLPDGWNAFNLQTKHFGCELDLYIITHNGRLIRRYVSNLQAQPERHSESDMDFHGIFRFYGTDAKKKWHEYAAKFTDGQLVRLETVSDFFQTVKSSSET